jgi:hypothetical protein
LLPHSRTLAPQPASRQNCCGPWRSHSFSREILPLFRSLCVHILIKDQSHWRQHAVIKTHCCLQGLETSKSWWNWTSSF